MKVCVFIGLVTLLAQQSFSQGSIQFNNRVTGTTTAAVVAPVYGVDPSDPTAYKTGNAATGPTTPIPMGTQTYAGAALTGSGWTASLWARPAGSSGPFVFAASTPFRTTTSTSLYGFWTIPSTAVVLPNVPSDPAVRAEIVIRVWDNRGGTITSWDQLYDPATGVANPQYWYVANGQSAPFVEADQLGGGVILPPTLKGLQSFQLYSVPEPSVFALLGVAIGYSIARRRNRSR